ncbi:hypothetical protein Q787_01040 [Ornithobacterium rhinotracheale H06-030791]|nr:hypothetical protein Q785_01075 [Ornithobacterium rhinotracheale ORT-UMN 88]KGB67807.1 hypothetical protein Q787_01040 [Ornithobacterium rhinotracheale H06-030791]
MRIPPNFYAHREKIACACNFSAKLSQVFYTISLSYFKLNPIKIFSTNTEMAERLTI